MTEAYSTTAESSPRTLLVGSAPPWSQTLAEKLAACDGRAVAVLSAKMPGEANPTSLQLHSCNLASRADVHRAVEDVLSASEIERVILQPEVCQSSTNLATVTDQLEEAVRGNCLGAIYVLERLLPKFIERERGHVLAVVPAFARTPQEGTAAAGTSGVALATYLESLRPPLKLRGVGVTIGYLGGPSQWGLAEVNGSGEQYLEFVAEILAMLEKPPLECELPRRPGFMARWWRRAEPDLLNQELTIP